MKTFFALVLSSAVLATSCVSYPSTAPDPSATVPPKPEAVSVSQPMLSAAPTIASASKSQTMTVAWNAALDWNKPVKYIVGWGLAAGNYANTATTSATTYQATGLAPSTVYYVAVKTVDTDGNQSPWSQWYHYLTPKQTGPAKAQPVQ